MASTLDMARTICKRGEKSKGREQRAHSERSGVIRRLGS